MARPQKLTVDYFPHICKSGKTLAILENHFGNDGYAFWFKLLEILATTDGHYYQTENPMNWEFLLAKTHVATELARDIIQLLVQLDAIDKDLWDKHKVIWVQKLVDNVADAYRNRTTRLPHKPSFDGSKPLMADSSLVENSIPIDISSTINSQTKLNNSKLNNSKEGDGKSSPTIPIKNNEVLTVTKLDDNSVTLSIIKTERGEKIAEVFARIDKERGYRPTKRKAEAAAIGRMLKHYTTNEIIETWQSLKQDKFWARQELFMMTVETQIGAITKNKQRTDNGKYAHMVKTE